MATQNAVATVSLRVPDDVAVEYALPGGIPADRVGVELASFDSSSMTNADKRTLRSVLEATAFEIGEVSGRFPVGTFTQGSTHGLGIDSSGIDHARDILLANVRGAGLGSYLIPRKDDAPEMVVLSSGFGVAQTYKTSNLPTPVDMVFTELMVTEGEKKKNFTLGNGYPASAAQMVTPSNAPLVAAAVKEGGARFVIPLLVPEGVKTGDGRIFEPLSLTTRDLPIPLQWQIKSANGHDGSVLVGRIDSIERVSNGLGNAHGVFDTGPYGQEAERLVRSQMLRGVSADLDQFEAADVDMASQEESGTITIKKGRVMAATLVTRPAFQECRIELSEDAPTMEISEQREDDAVVACAMIASSIPVTPPREWFDNPKLTSPMPLSVTDDGQVFGHIALWHVSHLGLPGSTKPPRSRSDYAYFKTGVVRTDDGSDIHVGQLTLAGGHADLAMSAHAAIKHYDETKSAVADITAGEDAFGIWVAGALRPGVTAEQIRTLRASAPSGDWRPINGRLELVAICQVNVPGFPVARARVASGYVTALVAAGASAVAQLSQSSHEESAAHAALIPASKDELALAAASARARVSSMAADLDEEALFRNYSADTRAAYAKSGAAMPDGSFPVMTKQDVKNAIRAHGRVRDSKKQREVKKHIIRRAKKLKVPDLIPSEWSKLSVEVDAELQSLRVQAMVASLRFRRPFSESDVLRDEIGRFRRKVAELHEEMLDTPGAEKAAESLAKAEKEAEEGNLKKAEKHAEDAQDIMHRFEEGFMERDTALKEGYSEQGGAMAQVIHEGGNASDKYRFTDLPETVQGMINAMLDEFDSQAGGEEVQQSVGDLLSYISGSDLATLAEIQSWISSVTAHLLALREEK